MKRRDVSIACDPATARQLATAVREFALAAYPPGGSECAQAAREALLETAKLCAAHGGGSLSLRRRQLPQLRSAIAWYFSEPGAASPALEHRLGQLLGRPV
jgi:hypothetical protein